MNKKKWCVRVFEQPHVESVWAETPEVAETIAMHKLFAGSYSGISHVEVKRVCVPCGFISDNNATKCRYCGNSIDAVEG